MKHPPEIYRRRRIAAAVLTLLLVVFVLLCFGLFGTKSTVALQGDLLGPDNESRADYVERVAGSVATADEPTYALVSFRESLNAQQVNAVVEPATRMNAIIIGMAAPIAVPEPVNGASRADVIDTEITRLRDSYQGVGQVEVPSKIDAVIVWSDGDSLRTIAQNNMVEAVEAAPSDAAWGTFGVRPLSSLKE
ncbi:hypothetical protein [Corynebacterium striatum]|uniref:Secreted protein n=1 Tax=Corynebacterium striatum TaxID=43770 RepID=A0AAQ1Z7T0_CORST|nr:hypothetical protein [Corynebacterium striatum]EEI78770.1 hypothetical protein HMPREF0308_0982 [Corynebacterium striatum ATCC 6940]QQE53871.1 hypothetical protein I6I11_04575 [Corynebacterium striatum]QRP17810.1 hypothetical protein I6J27_07460 [Corynebacterium striatum]STD37914.1 putative secreted protein [Corynebacterium striatum]STD62495.1 putative secreted protein [Corynebacterium striatum]